MDFLYSLSVFDGIALLNALLVELYLSALVVFIVGRKCKVEGISIAQAALSSVFFFPLLAYPPLFYLAPYTLGSAFTSLLDTVIWLVIAAYVFVVLALVHPSKEFIKIGIMTGAVIALWHPLFFFVSGMFGVPVLLIITVLVAAFTALLYVLTKLLRLERATLGHALLSSTGILIGFVCLHFVLIPDAVAIWIHVGRALLTLAMVYIVLQAVYTSRKTVSTIVLTAVTVAAWYTCMFMFY